MIEVLAEFIDLYCSGIPYAVFLLFLNDRQKDLKKTLLYLIPYNILFFAVYRGSLLIPNELAGMLIKTICSRILIVVFFQRILKISILRTLLQSYMASVIVMFSELFLSVFFDVSWFTHYLSQESNIIYVTSVSLFHSFFETIAAWAAVKLSKRFYRPIRIPTRYHLIAILSLALVTTEGALLYYLNNSSFVFPLPFIILLVLVSLAATVLPLSVLRDEERLKQVISRLPVFRSSREHLDKQLEYLRSQTNDLKEAKKSLESYKAEADFSASVNEVFHSREGFIDSLYTDNPAINTLLLYYADRFDKDGIRYSFEMHCSTYTDFPDYNLIYLFSGLLDTSRNYAELSMDKNANIYTVSFSTDESARQDIISFLNSSSMLFENKDTMSFNMTKNLTKLTLRI